MIDTLFNINPVFSLLIFLTGIVLTGFIPYLLGHWFLGRTASEKTKEFTSHLFRATGMLLGLMLSLNFSNVRSEYVRIQDSVELEAKDVSELVHDFRRFGSDDAIKLQSKLLEYLKVVINDEWPRLAKGSLSLQAQELFLEVEDGILNFKPETSYQQDLKTRLLKDIDEISDHRSARIYAGNVNLNWFIMVVLVGFFLSNFLLCVYPVKPSTLVFISCYSSFIGVVLYSIVDLHHPYHGITHVSVKPFQTVYDTLSLQPLQIQFE